MHDPVLFKEVIAWLQPRPGARYIDGTIGAGGHARGILEGSAPTGRLLGLDVDPEAVERAMAALSSYGDRVVIVQENFAHLRRVAEEMGFVPADGILLDLGLSSWQLESAQRGFSFQRDGPLDMRFDPEQRFDAARIVNRFSEEELADILWRFGEERRSRRIARAIVASRPIKTTTELAQVIRSAVGGRYDDQLDTVTRVFQALRIRVNRELDALAEVLPQARDVLASGGRLVVISFHSLEDRLVKEFFQRESRDCLCPPELPACACGHKATLKVLTRKPVRPTADEVKENPRSHSARLRVAEKL